MTPRTAPRAGEPRGRKGVTPIVAIVILMLITVALAGTAMSYLQGFLFQTITKNFQVPSGGGFCEGGIIKVYITNTGYESDITSPTDFTVASVDGVDLKLSFGGGQNITAVTIKPGASALVVNFNCNLYCGISGTGVSGYHSVTLGTSSTVLHPRVFCP